MLSRIRHRLGLIGGFLLMHRWPWLRWRVSGGGTLPVGAYSFRFVDLSSAKQVWWAHQARRRTWEQPVIRELTRILRPGDVFLDLGAYVGPFTLLASRLVGDSGCVVAFEPDPATRTVLERNVAANRAANVTVVPAAVGREAGVVRFVGSGDSAGRIDSGGELEVPQVALDEFCAEHGITPTVMKVDIEGGESDALSGSQVVRGVRELLIEVHGPQLRAQGVDPDAFLDALGQHRRLETGHFAVTPRAAA